MGGGIYLIGKLILTLIQRNRIIPMYKGGDKRAEQELEIEYSNKRIKKICTDAGAARKAYGSEMAKKIHQRIDEIRASLSVESLVQFRIGRCHFLSGRRRLQ